MGAGPGGGGGGQGDVAGAVEGIGSVGPDVGVGPASESGAEGLEGIGISAGGSVLGGPVDAASPASPQGGGQTIIINPPQDPLPPQAQPGEPVTQEPSTPVRSLINTTEGLGGVAGRNRRQRGASLINQLGLAPTTRKTLLGQ